MLINSYKSESLLQGMFISFFEPIFQPLQRELSTKNADRKNRLTDWKINPKKKFCNNSQPINKPSNQILF